MRRRQGVGVVTSRRSARLGGWDARGLGHLEGLPPERTEQLSEAVQGCSICPRAARRLRRAGAAASACGSVAARGIGPSWIVEALRGEPHVVAAALVYLPTIRVQWSALPARCVRRCPIGRRRRASSNSGWFAVATF